jgi:hypothetical protein
LLGGCLLVPHFAWLFSSDDDGRDRFCTPRRQLSTGIAVVVTRLDEVVYR